jgi:hypothetical protein
VGTDGKLRQASRRGLREFSGLEAGCHYPSSYHSDSFRPLQSFANMKQFTECLGSNAHA